MDQKRGVALTRFLIRKCYSQTKTLQENVITISKEQERNNEKLWTDERECHKKKVERTKRRKVRMRMRSGSWKQKDTQCEVRHVEVSKASFRPESRHSSNFEWNVTD